MSSFRRALLCEVLIAFLVAVGADSGRAEPVTFESGNDQTTLLELFTSEGCSSCPPAEAWFSKLKAEPGLWKDFVPVAFHVDYWDRLGWRDPYAAKEWTARQYEYSARWKSESVYTPAFVLDGRERRERAVPTPASETSGVLKLTVGSGRITAEFNPPHLVSNDVHLQVATLGFDLSTKVTAGENSGHNLRHDFVVLSLADKKMTDGKLAFPFAIDPRATAIAAWVVVPDQPEPIQAVGGWLR